MKRLLLIVTATIFLFILGSAAWYMSKLKPSGKVAAGNTKADLPDKLLLKLESRAAQARKYAAKNEYNTTTCFLIDMSIASGKERFFVYDLTNDSILQAGLVTHGSCNETWLTGRRYGNEPGCNCTSLGKYKVGNPYQGKFGLAYKLYGQDASNSNAFKRFVVLHSMECVPASSVHPAPICQSYGCPAVSPAFLKKLAATINTSPRPILLWIFE